MATPDAEERRVAVPDRRRYNKRVVPEGSPPYFEVFERIAVALETIAAKLPDRDVRLPDAGHRPVPPRRPS